MIARIGLGHGRELARGGPIELAAVDDDAADGDAVAAEKLGGRMHDDVGAVLEGPAQVGRGEGGIEHQRQLVAVRDVRHRLDVEHFQARIAERLGEHQARLVGDGLVEACRIARIGQRGGDAEARQRMREHVVRAAVDARRRHDVPARAHQRGDGEMQRGLPAGGRHRADAAFQRRDALLEHRDGGIGDARIDVPGALQVEQPGGVLDVVEHVGRGLVDRHGARARRRIGLLAGVQRERIEAGAFWCGHLSSRPERESERTGTQGRVCSPESLLVSLSAKFRMTIAYPRAACTPAYA